MIGQNDDFYERAKIGWETTGFSRERNRIRSNDVFYLRGEILTD